MRVISDSGVCMINKENITLHLTILDPDHWKANNEFGNCFLKQFSILTKKKKKKKYLIIKKLFFLKNIFLLFFIYF